MQCGCPGQQRGLLGRPVRLSSSTQHPPCQRQAAVTLPTCASMPTGSCCAARPNAFQVRHYRLGRRSASPVGPKPCSSGNSGPSGNCVRDPVSHNSHRGLADAVRYLPRPLSPAAADRPAALGPSPVNRSPSSRPHSRLSCSNRRAAAAGSALAPARPAPLRPRFLTLGFWSPPCGSYACVRLPPPVPPVRRPSAASTRPLRIARCSSVSSAPCSKCELIHQDLAGHPVRPLHAREVERLLRGR